MIQRALVVINPGARRAVRLAPRVCQALRDAGVAVDRYETVAVGDAARVTAERGPLVDAIFSLGGDGTAMEVLSAAAEMQTPVGILRGGTGNLVAQAIGVPASATRAVRALLAAPARTIDLVQASDGRRFAFAAGVGIDVAMLERTNSRLKRWVGTLAYAVAATRAALPPKPFSLQVIVDGEEHHFQAVLAFVANFGTVFGGTLTLAPGVVPNDGYLDLCVYTPRNVRASLRVAWQMWRGRFRAGDVHVMRGREITLQATPPRRTQADGELLGNTPVTYRVMPMAVRLLVPQRSRWPAAEPAST